MPTTKWRYMPILKWKKGEQDALRYLWPEQWDGVTPMVEMLPISAAPETASLKSALSAYTDLIAKQLEKTAADEQEIAVDTGYVSPGYAHQISLLLGVCNRLQKKVQNQIIPVVRANWLSSLGALTQSVQDSLKSYPELILRIRTDELLATQVVPSVAELSKYVKRKQIHIVIDQFSLVDCQPATCTPVVNSYLQQAYLAGVASVTLAGGSFPVNLMGKKQGFTDIARVEWQVWNKINATGEFQGLRYADYTVSHPELQDDDIDPKKVNPSISIRYASDNFWRLYKGKGFKGAPSGQLHSLCQLLILDPIYGGKSFSYGDGKYMSYANDPAGKNGIPWTWRRDATNRHIALVIDSL